MAFNCGCRTEVGGVTSVNEAAEYWNDPSVTYFPQDEKGFRYSRESESSIRTEIIGRITIVSGDLHSENPTDFQLIEIHDETNLRTYTLRLRSDSFASDLGYNLDGQLAYIFLDVEIPTDAKELDDDHIVSFGPLQYKLQHKLALEPSREEGQGFTPNRKYLFFGATG